MGKWEFKEWMLVEVWGLRNRCGYIGRYMDVIDKGFFYLIKKKPRLLLIYENQLPTPNLLLAGFPIAKACLLFFQRKNSPYY